ncbi:hypothetical protein ACO2Q0_12140 [Phenylobacterium sp. VNQ135]|uniref:hypothetical protein n=1 Tax=Phenylobacterium sp. VNQ135 TaxID=3400922 RepID=UPI003C000877
MPTDSAATYAAVLTLGAMAWPLAAGLFVVMWTKVRARQVQAARVAVRVRDRR